MKQPRTSDFDPSAKPKTHELKSSMENLPTIEKPPVLRAASQAPTSIDRMVSQNQSDGQRELMQRRLRVAAPAQSKAGDSGAPNPTKQPAKRLIKTRHPFDIYHDQLDKLKRLAFEEKMNGGLGSMSAMVREALDAWLDKRH